MAQAKLGILFRTGINVQQNLTEAVKWLRLAAEQGNPDGQYNLARHYATGLGVERDFIQSYVWYELADDSCPVGSNKSQCAEFRDSIARVLSPLELQQAEKLAATMKVRIATGTP